jgi:hypothetical protein
VAFPASELFAHPSKGGIREAIIFEVLSDEESRLDCRVVYGGYKYMINAGWR